MGISNANIEGIIEEFRYFSVIIGNHYKSEVNIIGVMVRGESHRRSR